MCCSSCRDTSEPSEIPSSTSTVWVRIGGTVSGRPAMAAMPTAIMAAGIRPPGRFAHKNSAPPAVPIASVSSTLRVLVRLGMADAIDAGMRLTPPYGKSGSRGQMRQRTAAMRAWVRLSRHQPQPPSLAYAVLRTAKPGDDSCGKATLSRSLRLVSPAFLAFRHELLALLAVD